MAGSIKKLAAQLFKIKNDALLEVTRFGADSSGALVFEPSVNFPVAFKCVRFFDGDLAKPRSVIRSEDAAMEQLSDGRFQIAMVLPFPVALFPDIPDFKGVPDFLAQIMFTISPEPPELFAADGTLKIQEYQLKYASWNPGGQQPGDAPPQDEAHYVDEQGNHKPISLKALTDKSADGSVELDIFGTNASQAVRNSIYPLLGSGFAARKNFEFKDRIDIQARPSPDFNFDMPRAVGIKPAAIRSSAQTSALSSFCFSAIVGFGPKKSGNAAIADVVFDNGFRADGIEFKGNADVELVQDVNNDRYLSPDKIGQPDTTEFYFYMRVRSVPATVFSTIWNERVAKPYLDALRITDDARDLSFVPLIENIQSIKSGSKLPPLELLFDVVQHLQGRKASIVSAPTLIGFRPDAAKEVQFAADAVFPGLITHDGKVVRRRVKITIERQHLEETFEWFDVPPPKANKRPEIIIIMETDESLVQGLAGGKVRIGALDLDVPEKFDPRVLGRPDDDQGRIKVRYNVTFDSADPTRATSSSAERDPKGKSGRARLPRRGEAIPRIAARIDRFDLYGVLPGSQDAVPDAGQAFDAILEELARATSDDSADPNYKAIRREKRIEGDLRREPPIVIVDAVAKSKLLPVLKDTPFFLHGEEVTANNKNRRLSLTLHRRAPNAASPDYRTIVIDPEPMTVALVDVPAFELDSPDVAENDGEVANWQTSELEGSRWEIARISDGFALFFPPQAVGEAAEKGQPWPAVSKEKPDATTLDYRLGTAARLSLRSSYFKQHYAEAPWNLRRVLGFAGQRAPGAGINTARFEFLYGLASRFTAPSLRLAEFGSRIGGVRDPLPARPRGITRSLLDETETTKSIMASDSEQPLVEAELYDRFRGASASFTKVWGTRVALFESYREGSDDPLALEETVAFTLRLNGDPATAAKVVPDPWNPSSTSTLLKGGATWGFESKNIYNEVAGVPTDPPPVSTRGQIVNPAFSALGGSGFVRAFFANGKSRIVSDTSFGRTHTYAVERIGRIGVFWNVAKHVIVYQRTVLPSDQFGKEQAGQHFGRPVLRKVQEYVDILEPERAYPENGAALKTRGFVEACLFRTRRIPVTSRWGHDIPDGWIVPLWKEGEDPDIYPKPDVRLQLTAAQTDAAATIPGRFSDPSQLVFFTSTRKQDGDNPNLWAPRPDIDFVNVPHPAPVGEPALDPNTPDGKAPNDNMHDSLLASCTFDIDSANAATNLVTARTNANPIGAVLETVTMMRSGPTGASGGPAGQALALRQELDHILGDARRLEDVLNEALSVGRTALGNLLGVAGKTKGEIEDAINTEIDRLGEVKNLIHREAAAVRKTIADAAGRAKDNLDGAKSGWTDARDKVQARLKAEIQKALLSRMDTLSGELDKVVGQVDEFVDGVDADKAEVLARRIEEALAPVRLTIFSAISMIGEGLARLDQNVKALRREIDASRDALERGAAELKGKLAQADWRPLVTLYEEYNSKALTALDAADRLARRDLPKAIKEAKLFPAPKKLEEFLRDTRGALNAAHDNAVAAITKQGATLDQARIDVVKAVDASVAAIGAVSDQMQRLTDEAARLVGAADTALAEFGSKLEATYDAKIKKIHDICSVAASGIPAIKEEVKKELNALRQIAIDLRSKVDKAVDGVLIAVGGLLDEIGVAIDQQELKLKGALDQASQAANSTVGNLENKLVDAIDGAIAQIRGQAGNLAAAVANASDALKKGAADIVNGLRDKIPPGLADDIRVLEEGYKRLASAPTFQNPSETLALIRAAGSSPILPNLTFNRDRIAYFFDDARDAVKSSPVVALMNRLGDDLKALGIRVPTGEFLERLIPKDLDKIDFGKIFPDLGGLKLDGLFKNVRLPPSLNDKVKVTHGFDKASLTAWAKAEAKAPFPKRAEIFEFGPLKLSVLDSSFDALADIAVGIDGKTRRTTRAEVVGDWELAFSGQPLVTLEQTRVFFENGKGLDVDIDPTRVRLDQAIKFLSDLIKSFSDPDSGFFLEMLEDNGVPAGLAARIELPLPPLSFGAFSITGLRFTSSFELLMIKGSGGKRGDFALGTTLALGLKKEPFILRVWILVGGGWLETRAKYFPSSGKLTSAVSIGLTAGLGLDFAFGPCRGYVFVMVGGYVEFESGTGNSFSIAIIFLVRGGIVILGRFNIGLYLLLELIYQQDGSLIGRGTIEVSFKICWCCEIKVRQGVTYLLRKGSSSNVSTASAHQLDNFA